MLYLIARFYLWSTICRISRVQRCCTQLMFAIDLFTSSISFSYFVSVYASTELWSRRTQLRRPYPSLGFLLRIFFTLRLTFDKKIKSVANKTWYVLKFKFQIGITCKRLSNIKTIFEQKKMPTPDPNVDLTGARSIKYE